MLFRRSSAAEPLPVYMHPVEFSQVVAAVEAIRPRRVLEWGSGGSTRAMLQRFPFIERYVSIEHEAPWYERVRSVVRDPRLSLHHVPPDKPLPAGTPIRKMRQWERRCEVDPSICPTYVEFPRRLGERFNLVLVDGRARVYCMRAGFDLLDPGGLLIVHDAEREVYAETIESLGRSVYLEPWKQGQVCLIRKS